MSFEIIGKINKVETFAAGNQIRELPRLTKIYGKGKWRKRKRIAEIRLPGDKVMLAEIHWYEASGIGKREFKNKTLFGVKANAFYKKTSPSFCRVYSK